MAANEDKTQNAVEAKPAEPQKTDALPKAYPAFRTLRADEIDVRIGTTKMSNGDVESLTLLLYKNARCDQNLLDETVGPLNWQRHHSRNNANCIISIWDPEKKEWVEKEDTGTESNTEKEKGLASDSFKRAGFNWGIGRELYTPPFIKLYKNKNQYDTYKGKCYNNFSVQEIEYNSRREISKLVIYNEKLKKVVFTWSATADDRPILPEKDVPPEPNAAVTTGDKVPPIAFDTGKAISEFCKKYALSVDQFTRLRAELVTDKIVEDIPAKELNELHTKILFAAMESRLKGEAE